MSGSLSPPRLVNVEPKRGLPDNCVFADRYSFEDLGDYKLLYFGRAGQTRPTHGISLSAQAIADSAKPLKGFFERLPMPRDGISFETRDFSPSVAIFPVDMINVSHRGNEAEFLFCSYSLRDLALASKSTKQSKADVFIEASPLLMVRCPLAMVHSLLMKLFSGT